MGGNQTGDELLTVSEVAQLLKLNQQTIRNWIDAGDLPAVRIGRRIRVQASAIEDLVGRRLAPPAGPPPSGALDDLDRRAIAEALDEMAAGMQAVATGLKRVAKAIRHA